MIQDREPTIRPFRTEKSDAAQWVISSWIPITSAVKLWLSDVPIISLDLEIAWSWSRSLPARSNSSFNEACSISFSIWSSISAGLESKYFTSLIASSL